MKDRYEVLSCGAGVQSSFLLEASLDGVLPPLDAVIFADTRWEPESVYRHLDYLRGRCAKRGLPFHVVSAGDLRADALRSSVRGKVDGEDKRWASLPFYTYPKDAPRKEDGTAIYKYVGMIRRQCTREYKITPVRKAIRQLVLGVGPRSKLPPGLVSLWRGISYDEAERASVSEIKYIVHRHPLLTDLSGPARRQLYPIGYTRQDCLDWLLLNGKPKPPRSACIGCPFHSDDEWFALQAQPHEWEEACRFDEAIRDQSELHGQVFLHETCVPLRLANLHPGKVPEQGGMRNECRGVCGV